MGARSVRSCYSGQSDVVEPQAHEKSAWRRYHERVVTAGRAMDGWEDEAVRSAFIKTMFDGRAATNTEQEEVA